MSWLRDAPLRRKLIVAFALVSGGALLIAATVLVALELQQLRRDAADQLTAEAAVIGANSSAAIAFRDEQAARETLASLGVIPDVILAVLYDEAGNVLARYGEEADFQRPNLDKPRHLFRDGHLTVVHHIELDGKRIGTLLLHSDLHTRYAALRFDILATVGIALFAFVLALLAALRLQRVISHPILRLVEFVQHVSREGDYALRAQARARDEVGQLADGINEMLETVQHRDRELEEHRGRLEAEVAERTADLEESNRRLTAELTERERTQAQLARAHAELERHNRETGLVTEMNDRLQVCRGVDELTPVIELYGERLLPDASGSVHVLDEARALLEPLAGWGDNPDRSVYGPEDCWGLRRGKAHPVRAPGEGLVCPHVGDVVPPGGYVCVPMLAQGSVVGLLHLRWPQPAAPDETSPLEASMNTAASAAERLALAITSLRLRERLREQSVRDPLTGLYNRRYMEESLERELARALRTEDPLAVIMMDLDHFKRFNDTHGHDAGDELLRGLGTLLQDSMRDEDVACRYGGEEFTLILSHTDAGVARRRVEELREDVAAMDVRHHGRNLGGVTISAGVAAFPQHGETIDELLGAADKALYAAKDAGRDRVVVFDGQERPPPDESVVDDAAS